MAPRGAKEPIKSFRDLKAADQKRWKTNFLKRNPQAIASTATGTWRGGRFLGQGGMGCAGLWVLIVSLSQPAVYLVLPQLHQDYRR